MSALLFKAVLPIVVLFGAVAGALKIVAGEPEPTPIAQQNRAPLVRVETATEVRERLDVEAFGVVQPTTETSIVAQVAGRVDEVAPSFKDGGFFEEGDVLLRIDPKDYELAVTETEAAVAEAQALLERVEAEAEIARREWEEFGTGEANPLVLRAPQLKEARARLGSAGAQLKAAELNLGRTEVKAPFAGRVRKKVVDVAQYLTPGAPIARIYATDFAEVRLPIPDDQLEHLDLPIGARRGEKLEVPVTLTADFAGGRHNWQGAIVRTEAEVDPRSRVVHAIVRVKDPYARHQDGAPPLMVGMFVRAVIPGREITAISLPSRALRGRDQIAVVDEEGRLRFRRVRILRRGAEKVLVDSGIAAGEKVCVTDLRPAVDGMAVRVEGGEVR